LDLIPRQKGFLPHFSFEMTHQLSRNVICLDIFSDFTGSPNNFKTRTQSIFNIPTFSEFDPLPQHLFLTFFKRKVVESLIGFIGNKIGSMRRWENIFLKEK
jgi:hypothetical protein